MNQKSIIFNIEQFNNLFPFYILIDNHLKIQSFGKSLGEICNLVGQPIFTSLFNVESPEFKMLIVENIKTLTGQKILLKYKKQEHITLHGQFEYFPDKEQTLFVGFPSFNSLKELSEQKNTTCDLGIHSPMQDFFKTIEEQELATEDTKKLLSTVYKQKESLTGINNFAANMLNQVTVDEIAWTIIENAISRFSLEDCVIYLVDENRKYLIQRAAYGNKQKKDHQIFHPIKIKIGKGIVGKVALTGKPLLIKDTSKVADYIIDDKMRYSELAVPIIANNEVIGVIDSEHSSKNFFTHQHLIDFSTIASLTAIKIKNAITQEKNNSIEESVLRNQKMFQGVALATEELLANSNFDSSINKSLEILGKAAGVDRAYIFENSLDSNGELVTSQKYEWVSEGIEAQISNDDTQNVPISIFAKFLPQLYKKKPFKAIVSELDDELLIKEILISQDIQSILVVPIFHRNIFWGFIGYDDCVTEREWAQDELLLLKSFGNSLSSAFEITITAKELKDMALFPLENPNPVVRINLEGEVILINKPGEELKHAKGLDNREEFEERIYKGLSGRLSMENRTETFEIATGEKFYLATARLSETNEYINIYFSDITKQKEVEKEIIQSNKQLKLQEEKYRNIISNMNLGLLEVDTHDIIQYCNQSFTEISGFGLDEIKGKKASDLIFMNPRYGTIQNEGLTYLENTPDSFEILTKNKRGEARWWLISYASNFNDENKTIGSVGIYLDITKQKELEIALEKALLKSQKASESKELFLANMSHEIRTPLNGIIGMIRELNKEQMSHKQMGYLESAMKASRHLLSVVNNILEITKIEAGELNLIPNHFSVQELLNDVVSILEPQANDKDISLKISINKNVSKAFIADESRIRQILINLVGNSIKFTEKGEVIIDCSCVNMTGDSGCDCYLSTCPSDCSLASDSLKNTHLKFTIRDTGVGMNKHFLSNLFEKFQQEDLTISRKYGGTGLGLFITKKLIDLMSGSIKVWSTKGEGTEMYVCLPLPVGDLSKVKQKENFILEESLKNARVLLVEDHEINRLVAANTLSLLDVELTEVENGKEAVELLKEKTFDLILMDIQMPIMGGLEAASIIRNELKIETPIIALSANAFKSEIDLCIKTGMNDYVTKPFEEQELLRVIVKHHKISERRKIEKATTTIDVNEVKESLYNLQNLKEMSRENGDFVQKMLQLFVDTTPLYLKQINAFYKEKDIISLKKIAHKMKPSIDNMGITSIRQDVLDIELYNHENGSLKDLGLLIKKVTKVLSEVIKQLTEKELV